MWIDCRNLVASRNSPLYQQAGFFPGDHSPIQVPHVVLTNRDENLGCFATHPVTSVLEPDLDILSGRKFSRVIFEIIRSYQLGALISSK